MRCVDTFDAMSDLIEAKIFSKRDGLGLARQIKRNNNAGVPVRDGRIGRRQLVDSLLNYAIEIRIRYALRCQVKTITS